MPKARPEGPAKRDRAAAGLSDRATCVGAPYSPLRGRIFLQKTLLRPARSRPILPQPGWDRALRPVCLVRLLAKGVAPFASSPFVHPIPQSHCRTRGDLFIGSLGDTLSSVSRRCGKRTPSCCCEAKGNME
jgi:hypothetical protein